MRKTVFIKLIKDIDFMMDVITQEAVEKKNMDDVISYSKNRGVDLFRAAYVVGTIDGVSKLANFIYNRLRGVK